jgi:SulP family sulfate permease
VRARPVPEITAPSAFLFTRTGGVLLTVEAVESDSPPARPSLASQFKTFRIWLRYARRRLNRAAQRVNVDFFPGRKVTRHWPKEARAADVRAGLNVALLAFPQSIAYSLIAGLPPQFGLMSAALGQVFGPLFTKSRFIVLGPTNATAILLFSGLVSAGVSEGQMVVALPLFILLVGLFQIAGAIAGMALALNYVSRTVLTGYVTAAAALIIVNQLQNTLGFRITGESTFFGLLVDTIRHLPRTQWPEVLMAATALACYFGLKRHYPRLPAVAATLVVTALVAFPLDWSGWSVARLAGFSLGEIRVLAYQLDLELMGRLAPAALALAFVAVLEGTSVGKSLASRSGERLNVNQEIYGMGVANLISSAFGGMDTSGSLTRSALNWSSGARTVAATILGGVFIFALLFSVGFLIRYVPRAALAALVIVIAFSLFNLHHLRTAIRTTGSDAITFWVTTGSALLFKLDVGIYLGVLSSAVLFLRKAGVPELVEYEFNPEGQLAERRLAEGRRAAGISILHAEGDLFFGSTELFIEQTRQVIQDPSLRIIILRLKNARHLDATCVLAIEELLDFLRANRRDLIVSGADRRILRVFRNSGLLKKLGEENFHMEVPGNPTASTRNALKRAQQILGGEKAEIRIFVDAAKKAKEAAKSS